MRSSEGPTNAASAGASHRRVPLVTLTGVAVDSYPERPKSEEEGEGDLAKMPTTLDSYQREFCLAPADANLRLLAPAGCGKTLCLLERCEHLAQRASNSGGSPPRFLLVTFTRAATVELTDRIADRQRFPCLTSLANTQPGVIDVATLNAWGYRRIRKQAFSPRLLTSKSHYHFAVLNQLQPVWGQHERVAKAIKANRNTVPRRLMEVIDAFKSLGFDHTRHTKYSAFLAHMRCLAEQGLTARLDKQIDELARLNVIDTKFVGQHELAKTDKKQLYGRFFTFWRAAVRHLIESATFTFEDQKYVAYLHEQKAVEQSSFLSGAAAYSHVLVDEFQDINPLDLNVISAIAERSRAPLAVTGDDDQAIFEWRGASPQYILRPDSYLGRTFITHKLGVNYRSPANIVDHSQRLIRQNQRREPKAIRAARNGNARIEVTFISDFSHAIAAVDTVLQRAFSDGSRVAIIGRKRSQIIPFQVDFVSRGVQFCAAEDLQVFLSKTFDDLLDLLDIKTRAASKNGYASVKDALALCDKVKRFKLNKPDRTALLQHFGSHPPRGLLEAAGALRQYSGPLKRRKNGIRIAGEMADAIAGFTACGSVSETLEFFGNHFQGLHKDFGKADDDIFFLDPPLGRLAEYAQGHGDDYDRFIWDIRSAREQLAFVPKFHDDDGVPAEQADIFKRPVHLMTAPRAKGREFDYVVLLDVVDGIWPIRTKDQTEAEFEAERRLFYVAFTRTRKEIAMLVNERLGERETTPSPFIEELGA